jgi:RimJ/RimL family protein N-acetyltransferase
VRVVLRRTAERRSRVDSNIKSKPTTRTSGWRERLPSLVGRRVTLRELRQDDAPSLLSYLSNPSVLTYVAGAPQSLEGLRQFIRWCRRQRTQGAYLTFGIVPAGHRSAVGLVQIWAIEPDFSTAEWGFVIGEPFRASGLFFAAAELLLDFAFRTLHVQRLEARAVVEDGRGNRVLEKLGATCEGKLRSGFRSSGVVLDHAMWSILSREWPPRPVGQPRISGRGPEQ